MQSSSVIYIHIIVQPLTSPISRTFHHFFFMWPYHAACGISGPQPRTEPRPLAMKAQSPNHWTTREFQEFFILQNWNFVTIKCIPVSPSPPPTPGLGSLPATILSVSVNVTILRILYKWWAAVYGVTQSRTWLKWLSSSSSSSMCFYVTVLFHLT